MNESFSMKWQIKKKLIVANQMSEFLWRTETELNYRLMDLKDYTVCMEGLGANGQ